MIAFPLIFSGLTVHIFKGFPSLQEIECTAENLKAEVKVFSIKIHTLAENTILAHADPMTNECVTFQEMSSCTLDPSDTRKSRLKVLVSDLEEGERRGYVCTVTSFGSLGATNSLSWSVTVWRKSEFSSCARF